MNDSNETYQKLLFLVRSHSFSLILLGAGLAWTVMYIRSVMASTDTADLSQPTDMLYAGLALISAEFWPCLWSWTASLNRPTG